MTQALAQKLKQSCPEIYNALNKCVKKGVDRSDVSDIINRGFSCQADRDVALIVFDWMKKS